MLCAKARPLVTPKMKQQLARGKIPCFSETAALRASVDQEMANNSLCKLNKDKNQQNSLFCCWEEKSFLERQG